ncbi:type II secretion system secretin GspD [Sphingosinicella sp.]|uniref:type II secretion system secretin GspD n=1 Tax=Sphingosinicella sp. TaxID=1917971 RepID=UPI001793AC3B|nr:type II secretion system secretin GspD [Sphingosinicella sp.]MBA4759424.1 type II secretion system secretin GspD [Sphingosinicella sp.]MEA3539686.1 type II secretion system secretin GspD [Pseudomonadota bacterium]
MKVGRFLLGAAFALAFALPAPAQQVINLRDADIRAYIEDVARTTGRTFIIDPAVQGKVSVVADRPLSRTQYFEVFLSTLRANGFIAIPTDGGAFRIAPAANAAQQPTRGGSSSFVTQVIDLKSIDTQSAIEALRPLVSAQGQITASKSGSSVVIADYADNLARVRSVLKEIDRDRTSMRLITLDNAGAREIASAIESVSRAAGSDGAGAVSVIAVDSSNSVILRGDPDAVGRMAAIVSDLDKRASAGSDVQVVFLQNADAGALLPVLQQIAGQQVQVTVVNSAPQSGENGQMSNAAPSVSTTPAGSAPPGPGRAVIARYEGANALVISAPPDVQRSLSEVIRKLDVRQEQVLVEAIIVEISDNAAKQLGVQFLLAGTGGSSVPFAVTNYSNSAPNLLAIAGAIGARELDRTQTTTSDGVTTTGRTSSSAGDALEKAAVNSLLGVTGSLFGFGGEIGNDALFGAVINAVKSDTASNVLSTPSIMTLDNQEARILVGQEVPMTTGEALSPNFDNAFRTVQRQDVGVQLEVKPQINAGGAIKLFLRQEVSSIAGPVATGSADLIINKREIETTVTVDDGDIIALGGLIDENERRTIEKVPLLGDIPVLGEIFTSRSRSRTKTNLMVFIRPTIVRNRQDAQAISARRYAYTREMQQERYPKQEPSLDALVRDYMGAAPPVAPQPAPPPSE